MSEREMFKSCEDYWDNKPGTVLRSALDYSRNPLRIKIHDENIKGDFSHDMLEIDKLVQDTEVTYRGRPLQNGDVFEFVQVDNVIPWMEAIVGCHIYDLGRGASMVANPADVAPEGLPDHLRHLLGDLELRHASVEAKSGVVLVGGLVPTAGQKARAARVVSGISGVRGVFNRIVVEDSHSTCDQLQDQE